MSLAILTFQPLNLPGIAAADPAAEDRLAAIDIGSNSIHMIVVAPEPNGGWRVLGREREMVRLGRSALGAEGALSAEAIRDGLEALVKMTTLAGLKGARRVTAVATSAVREAANGREFLDRVKTQTGLEVAVLSGADEGRLIYRAVREVVDLGAGLATLVDVGGGSTEWITTRGGQLEKVVSLSLGSLRCAGALRGNLPAPPDRGSVEKLRRNIRKTLRNHLPREPTERLVATSGTAVCCADLVDFWAGKSGGGGLREVRSKDLAQVVTRLRLLSRTQIAALPPVGGPRSESLLAGAILLQELTLHAGVERFQVSDRALREGLVLEALGQPIPPAHEPEDLRRRQVQQLAERAESVYRHNRQTARLAVRLFDLTASVHGLGGREREWLEYAALLHDIGYSVHYNGHHKHSYYLIQNANLDAFDPGEIAIIAHVARFHRGAAPKLSHPALAALKPWQQKTIRKLAALLRLADALDRTHASRVEEVYAAIRPRRVQLEVLSPWDVRLELEAVAEQAELYREIFDRKLTARQGLETVVS